MWYVNVIDVYATGDITIVLYKLCDMWIILKSNSFISSRIVLYKLCDMWIQNIMANQIFQNSFI